MSSGAGRPGAQRGSARRPSRGTRCQAVPVWRGREDKEPGACEGRPRPSLSPTAGAAQLPPRTLCGRLRAGVRPRRRPHGRGEQRDQEPALRPAFPPSLPETRPRPCGRARPRRVKRLRAPALRHGALGPPGHSAPPVRAPVTETPGSTRPRPVCGRSSPCESVPPTRGDPSPCASAVLPSVLRLVTASLPAVPASPWPSRRGLRTPSRCGWTPRPSSSLVWLRNPDGSPHSPGPCRPPPVPKEGIFDCEKPEEARSAQE